MRADDITGDEGGEPNGDIKTNGLGRHRRLLLLGGPLLLLAAAAFFYLTGGRYVSTDDAYVRAARTDISTDVSGRVAALYVHDNQTVSKGEVLFRLDQRPFVIAVEEAKAELAGARLRVRGLKAAYAQHVAEVKAAQDTVAYLARELVRQEKLAAQGITTAAQLDAARHALEDARHALSAAEERRASALASLAGDARIPVSGHPLVEQAQAALDRAKLNLSYTVVKAPSAGVVAKVEQLQAGDYVRAGTPLFSLVSNRDVWVEANFKENELTYMRPGQTASISVDVYPGRRYTGKVASMSPGTGSSFSLLPPENATGNWVKVVQRIPVRISIDGNGAGGPPLYDGASATVDVDTHHSRLPPHF